MDKITKFVLEQAGFKNPENVAKIIGATSNPEVALEMILDIWEMPEIKENSTNNRLNGIENSTRELIEFRPLAKFGDQVKYSYQTKKEKIIYFSNDNFESKDAAKEEYYSNPEAWVNYKGTDRNYTYVETGELKSLDSTCSLEMWNK